MSETNKVVVTLKIGVDVDAFIDEMSTHGNVSPYVPERAVEIFNLKPESLRNVDFTMTREEMEELKKDDRVIDCRWGTKAENGIVAVTTGSQYVKAVRASTYVNSDDNNWGLVDCRKATNEFSNSSKEESTTYTLDGSNVDIVIFDSGLQVDHPEFQDANGVSRVKQIDWYSASGLSGTMPSGFYTDTDGHGTNVASIAAGKTYGWAKNANIYVMNSTKVSSYTMGFNLIRAWHSKKSINPKTGVKNPTIVNMSWGFRYQSSMTMPSGDELLSVISVTNYRGQSSNLPVIDFTAMFTDILKAAILLIIANPNMTEAQLDAALTLLFYTEYKKKFSSYLSEARNYGIYPQEISPYSSGKEEIPLGPAPIDITKISNFYFPATDESVNADAADCMMAGVILVGAAGNESYKIDVQNGVDYNNRVTIKTYSTNSMQAQLVSGLSRNPPSISTIAPTYTNDIYYMRGSSPTSVTVNQAHFYDNISGHPHQHYISDAVVCVGAIDYTYDSRKSTMYSSTKSTAKTYFSCTGPRVDVYAPGGMIAGAASNVINPKYSPYSPYYANNSFKQMKMSGTSQASPQVTGVLACILQQHPEYTQKDVQQWIRDNSINGKVYDEGINSHTNLFSLQGGDNRYLYYPYSESTTKISGSGSFQGGGFQLW